LDGSNPQVCHIGLLSAWIFASSAESVGWRTKAFDRSINSSIALKLSEVRRSPGRLHPSQLEEIHVPPEPQGKSKLWLGAIVAVAAAACVGIVFWWGHTTVSPPPPPKSDSASVELSATTSVLSLAANLPVNAIKAILEEKVPKSFKFDSKNGVRAYGEPSRGAITVRDDVPAKRVYFSAPVSGRVQVEKQVILKMSVGIDVRGGIDASFSPVVGKDWGVNPQLDLSAHLDNASTKIAGIDVNITGLVRGAVQNAVNGAKHSAQDAVAKALNVKPDIERIWKDINKVHQLSKSPPVWLRITPRKAMFRQMQIKVDSIESGLALELDSHVFIQEKAPDLLDAPLPELAIVPTLPDGFSLQIPIEISFDAINAQIKAELAKKPFELGDKASVTITSASIEPYGAGVLLTLAFRGKYGHFKSASGTLYVVGIPVFDTAKKQLRIDKLDYSAETKNILIKTADWIVHGALLEKMKAATVVNVGGEIDKAKADANKKLEELRTKLPKEINATATITDLGIERLIAVREKAVAVVTAKGKLSAKLQK